MTRFASVVTRDISESGVFVESQSPLSLPVYRLVQFQLEREASTTPLPGTLKQGKALAAVFRVAPPKGTGARHGLALRLMVDPGQAAMRRPAASVRPLSEGVRVSA